MTPPRFFRMGYLTGATTRITSALIQANLILALSSASATEILFANVVFGFGQFAGHAFALRYVLLWKSLRSAEITAMIGMSLPPLVLASMGFLKSPYTPWMLPIFFAWGLMGKTGYVVYVSWMRCIITHCWRVHYFTLRTTWGEIAGCSVTIAQLIILFGYSTQSNEQDLTIISLLTVIGAACYLVEALAYVYMPDAPVTKMHGTSISRLVQSILYPNVVALIGEHHFTAASLAVLASLSEYAIISSLGLPAWAALLPLLLGTVIAIGVLRYLKARMPTAKALAVGGAVSVTVAATLGIYAIAGGGYNYMLLCAMAVGAAGAITACQRKIVVLSTADRSPDPDAVVASFEGTLQLTTITLLSVASAITAQDGGLLYAYSLAVGLGVTGIAAGWLVPNLDNAAAR